MCIVLEVVVVCCAYKVLSVLLYDFNQNELFGSELIEGASREVR